MSKEQGQIMIGGKVTFDTDYDMKGAIERLTTDIADPGKATIKAELYLYRGFVKQLYGQNMGAFGDYYKASESNPADPLPICMQGIIVRKQGNHDLAISYFNTAIERSRTLFGDDEWAAPYVERGMTYSEKGDGAKAIADFSEALRLDPTDLNIYHLRGVEYTKLGMIGKGSLDMARSRGHVIVDEEAVLSPAPALAAVKGVAANPRLGKPDTVVKGDSKIFVAPPGVCPGIVPVRGVQ